MPASMTCAVPDCEGKPVTRGWCRKHYARWYRHGNPLGGGISNYAPGTTCSEADCQSPVRSRGLCGKHYARLLTKGRTTLEPKKPPAACSVEGCINLAARRGWCIMHDTRVRNHGSTGGPGRLRNPSGMICAADGCSSPATHRGLCLKHRRRQDRNGTTETNRLPRGDGMAFVRSLPSEDGECIIWPWGKSPTGYGLLDALGETLAHRVVCRVFHGNPPASGPNALHSCGNGHLGCVRPSHLRWGTQVDNAEDARAHGTLSRGSRHPGSVLVEWQIPIIRRDGRADAVIAREYGVSRKAISKVKRGETWKHVPWDEPPLDSAG